MDLQTARQLKVHLTRTLMGYPNNFLVFIIEDPTNEYYIKIFTATEVYE